MNLDDLKADWPRQHDELADRDFDKLAAGVVDRATKMEAGLRRRDWTEAAAAVFVVVMFGVILLPAEAPLLMKAGGVIIALGAIEIVIVLFWTRHRDQRPSPDMPLVEYCTAEIIRVDRQIRLLRSVNWWYSGPLMLGCCVMIYGMMRSIPELSALLHYAFLAAFYACFLAAMYIIYHINARAIETDLLPVRVHFEGVLNSLDRTAAESDAPVAD